MSPLPSLSSIEWMRGEAIERRGLEDVMVGVIGSCGVQDARDGRLKL